MNIGDIEYPSLKGKVSEAEWQTRVELAAIHRLVDLYGWFDLTMPGASARIPGTDHYLFTPKDLMFEEITASSLVKVTLDGEQISDGHFSYVPGTWYPMQAVHAGRPDANWVIHSHDRYGMALSARGEKLLPITQSAGFLIADGVAYHDYDGVETYEAQIPSIQRSLGDASVMILHNHGMLTLGPIAFAAFARMYTLRYACEVQLLAGRNDNLIQLGPDMIEVFRQEIDRGPAVGYPWPALLRKLDRLDPTYRD